MSYVFKTKLPIKVGDKLYSFYDKLIEDTVESIEIRATIKEVIEKSSGDMKIDESLSWTFGIKEGSISNTKSKELGSYYFLSKSDLKSKLVDEDFFRINYTNKFDYSIPVKFEIGQRISYAYEHWIKDSHFNKIDIHARYINNREPIIKIQYSIPDESLKFDEKDFEVQFHFNKEILVNKLLGL